MKKTNTIAVAMSGGVDSSVAAALLKYQGYTVFGITMIHHHNQESIQKNVSDAQTVCGQLGIPHHVIEIQKEFQERIIDNFIQEYLCGRTPNPCTRCNPTIKWGLLLEYAIKNGADKFATGHYARVTFNSNLSRYVLLKSLNEKKDQSYALWRLDQKQLAKTMFPLGELDKADVRNLAKSYGLNIAQKAESQEICFIPHDDYHSFIKNIISQSSIQIQPGLILSQGGLIVGEHRGTAFYTIGQRKGLGIALGHPVYVTEIDPLQNYIKIGSKNDLLSQGLLADQTNWISVHEPVEGMTVEARIRYKDPGYPALIEKVENGSVSICFDEPRSAVTPGQSVVFYQGDHLVGGGVIVRAIK